MEDQNLEDMDLVEMFLQLHDELHDQMGEESHIMLDLEDCTIHVF